MVVNLGPNADITLVNRWVGKNRKKIYIYKNNLNFRKAEKLRCLSVEAAGKIVAQVTRDAGRSK